MNLLVGRPADLFDFCPAEFCQDQNASLTEDKILAIGGRFRASPKKRRRFSLSVNNFTGAVRPQFESLGLSGMGVQLGSSSYHTT